MRDPFKIIVLSMWNIYSVLNSHSFRNNITNPYKLCVIHKFFHYENIFGNYCISKSISIPLFSNQSNRVDSQSGLHFQIWNDNFIVLAQLFNERSTNHCISSCPISHSSIINLDCGNISQSDLLFGSVWTTLSSSEKNQYVEYSTLYPISELLIRYIPYQGVLSP